MSDEAASNSKQARSSGALLLRRFIASLLTVAATIYLGVTFGRYLALFVVDCSIEEIAGVPIEWGLSAVGISYMFASFEKVLKVTFTFRDYMLNPDKKVTFYPDCVALALLVAYLTLLVVAFKGARSCKEEVNLPPKEVVYLLPKPLTSTTPLEWVPYFFVELASENKPNQGTTLSPQQKADLTRLLQSLRACLGEQTGQDIELEIRGYADSNEFPTDTLELNRKTANRRAEHLYQEILKILGDQEGKSRVIVSKVDWPKSDPTAMHRDRYFEASPLSVTGKLKDQGLFNRRADLLILKLGLCEQARSLRGGE